MGLAVRIAWVSWWSACVGGCSVILFNALGWRALLPSMPGVVTLLVLWAQYCYEVEEKHGN